MVQKNVDVSTRVAVNDQITAPQVRLVDQNGAQVGVVSRSEALFKSRQAGLDLVEISSSAQPPVCKMLDYGKFRYQQQKKEKELAKLNRANAVETKEIRLRPVTGEHDIGLKVKQAQEFLNGGDKVLFVVKFKGRENAHKNKGYEVLNQIKAMLPTAMVERGPGPQGDDAISIMFRPA